MYYSDLLNSSVTRQNINNISNSAGIARHSLLTASSGSCTTRRHSASFALQRRTAVRTIDALLVGFKTKPNAIGRERATISCYIAGVRDAICVKEFYYLWLVIVNDLGAFVFIVRQDFSYWLTPSRSFPIDEETSTFYRV
jgi:hypothetical protein